MYFFMIAFISIIRIIKIVVEPMLSYGMSGPRVEVAVIIAKIFQLSKGSSFFAIFLNYKLKNKTNTYVR